MKRVRVTIAGVMGCVAIAALATAALRDANAVSAGIAVVATLSALGVAVLCVVFQRGRRRAFWLGFAIFGIGYVGLAHQFLLGRPADAPSAVDSAHFDWPPLTGLLVDVMRSVLEPQPGDDQPTILDRIFRTDRRPGPIQTALDKPIVMPFSQETPLSDVLKYVQSATISPPELPSGLPIYVDPAGLLTAEKTMDSPITLNLQGQPLRTTLPLILKQLDLRYEVAEKLVLIKHVGDRGPEAWRFARIAHSLFALVFGLIGGIAGAIVYAKRDRAEAERA